LDLSGYVANISQSEGSLLGIRILTSIVPAAFLVLAIIFLCFYPIDEKMHARMVKEIEAGKGSASA
jgi:GPH family glycoside/pentoside/hexuronide:cation symporter